jgi:hypothetical protein
MARKAQIAPIITKKKALIMEYRVVPWRVPRRKALPRNMNSSPDINARRAATLRVVDLSMDNNIPFFCFPCKQKWAKEIFISWNSGIAAAL